MKIIKNTSLYDTKKLKGLFCHVHSQLSKYEGRLPHWKSLKIQVMDKVQGRHASGSAYVGNVERHRQYRTEVPDMWLSLNKETSLEVIAQLFGHELMHSYGYQHSQYRTDPLEQHHIDEINRKFKQQDFLKLKAFTIKQPRKPRVIRDWKLRTMNLVAQYSWLTVYVKQGYESEMEIEVFDDRLDFEHFYDHWLYTYTDMTTSWYKAYNLAKKLIKGDIQKELTENWTVGLNAEWEEE